jgi:ferritin-like metal-binding protein YciE
MPEAKTLNARDAKLVQWLTEAYSKEAELEADLTAHIALTEKMPYKKRLRKHLTETRDHKRRVAARIKKLGGSASSNSLPGVPNVVGEAAGKAVAAVKGQVGVARGLVNPQAETHLRNAQEELREEHVEIAIYTRIEAFATEVGDKETAQLAKSIRRDEERMAKYLDAELVRLVKDVVRAEIPRDERATPRRRSTGRRSTSRSASARSRTATGVVRSTGRSGSGRSTSSRSTTSRSSSGRSSSGRSTSARSTSGRSTGARSTGARSSSGRATSKSSGSRGGSTSRNGASATRRSTSRARTTSRA